MGSDEGLRGRRQAHLPRRERRLGNDDVDALSALYVPDVHFRKPGRSPDAEHRVRHLSRDRRTTAARARTSRRPHATATHLSLDRLSHRRQPHRDLRVPARCARRRADGLRRGNGDRRRTDPSGGTASTGAGAASRSSKTTPTTSSGPRRPAAPSVSGTARSAQRALDRGRLRCPVRGQPAPEPGQGSPARNARTALYRARSSLGV